MSYTSGLALQGTPRALRVAINLLLTKGYMPRSVLISERSQDTHTPGQPDYVGIGAGRHEPTNWSSTAEHKQFRRTS